MDENLLIDLSKYPGHNIGGALMANLAAMKKYKVTGGFLKVANEYWHGTFGLGGLTVGFSTPLTVCRGAYLQMASVGEEERSTSGASERVSETEKKEKKQRKEKDTSFIASLEEWAKVWRMKPVHFAPTFKFSSDYQTCAICTEDYKAGETLTRLAECRHCFHYECFKKWQHKDQSQLDVLLAAINEVTIAAACPLCNKISK